MHTGAHARTHIHTHTHAHTHAIVQINTLYTHIVIAIFANQILLRYLNHIDIIMFHYCVARTTFRFVLTVHI